MPQTNYSLYQFKGYEGQIADATPTRIRAGFTPAVVAGEPDGRYPIGRIYVREAADPVGQAKLPAAGQTNPQVVGVAVFDGTHEKTMNGVLGVPASQPINLLQEGTFYALVEQNVTPNSAVFYRTTANTTPGAFDGFGRLRTDADTARAVALPNARFLESAVAGTLCKVAVNFT